MKRHVTFVFVVGLLLTGCSGASTSALEVVKPPVSAQFVHEPQTSGQLLDRAPSSSPAIVPAEESTTLSDKEYRHLELQKYLRIDVVPRDKTLPNCVLRADNVLRLAPYYGPYVGPDRLNVRAVYEIRHTSKPSPKGEPQECRDGTYVLLTDKQWRSKTGELQPYTK